MEPTLSLTQAQAVVAGKTAPKVTAQSIEGKIASIEYRTMLDTTTLCLIEMQNGFRFIGTSTPASRENFDPEVGKRYAYENAFKQIWTHEGYLLRERLAAAHD